MRILGGRQPEKRDLEAEVTTLRKFVEGITLGTCSCGGGFKFKEVTTYGYMSSVTSTKLQCTRCKRIGMLTITPEERRKKAR